MTPWLILTALATIIGFVVMVVIVMSVVCTIITLAGIPALLAIGFIIFLACNFSRTSRKRPNPEVTP